jgi:V-type H+-transporting ATPase subunit D
MGRVLQLASFSLAEVTYTTGDIGFQVQESVKQASYTVRAKQENVSGVVLPAFEGVRSKEGNGRCLTVFQVCPKDLVVDLLLSIRMAVDFNLTGLSRGGQQIQKSRETYVKAVGTLVELASLQVSSIDLLS